MKENCNIVNDFVHKNTVTIQNGDATDKVPSVVKIFTSAVGNVSYGCLDDRSYDFLADNSRTHVDVFKLSRYIFPKEDPGPTMAGKTEVHDLQGLEYAVNLACHRLNFDLKTHWDEICVRDVSFPEITSNGVLSTQFDLKQQINLYKKAQEKDRYISTLSHEGDLTTDILATETYQSRYFLLNRMEKQS